MLQPSVLTAVIALCTIVASPAVAHTDKPIIRVIAAPAPVAGAGLVPVLLIAGAYAMVRRYRNRKKISGVQVLGNSAPPRTSRNSDERLYGTRSEGFTA
jgi:hypothetical protein